MHRPVKILKNNNNKFSKINESIHHIKSYGEGIYSNNQDYQYIETRNSSSQTNNSKKPITILERILKIEANTHNINSHINIPINKEKFYKSKNNLIDNLKRFKKKITND